MTFSSPHSGPGHASRARWRVVVVAAAAVLASIVGLMAPPPARAWDSFPPGADSHGAITKHAILDILADPDQPADLKQWIAANAVMLTEFTTKVPFNPLGELVHTTKRPLDRGVDLESCEPRSDLEEHTTGAARWAVGSNPGDTHPEYWWQTALCLWRGGNRVHATAVLGQLIHSVVDQGALPHAFYKMHGGIGEDQGFEYLSALTPYDTTYYQHPESVLYPGKNVLDIADHGDGEYATFNIPKHTGWTPILLSPRSADSHPAHLQATSPTHVRLDFAVKELTALPVIHVAVKYETADGGGRYKEISKDLQLSGVPGVWAHVDLYDNFASNGRIWVSFNRTEHGYRSSTGQVQVYVVDSHGIGADAAKPALRHPWEYYDWLREWTQWTASDPYWHRYFPGLDAGGDLDFDWIWEIAPNSERAILTAQWAMSEQVTIWVLEDAFRLFNDPSYSLTDAVGQGYRTAFYKDHNFNSSGGSPEEIVSYAIGCEPYDGGQCGSFVAPAYQDAHPTVGDGLFAAAGTGDKVTMKADTLPSMLDQKISSVETRGATVYLYSGQNLTGDVVAIDDDTADLSAVVDQSGQTVNFNDRTRSIRIVPPTVKDPPTARADYRTTPENASVTIPVLDNDTVRDPSDVTITVRHPAHGTASVADGAIIYTPEQDFTKRWPLADSFRYEVRDNATGAADSALITVDVGGINHAPRDVALDMMVGDTAVTSSHEGDQVTAVGTFVDEDAGDAHTVSVNWGDGSAATNIALGVGVTEFQANHTYLDNNTPGTPYTVSSAVTDAAGAAATDSTTIDVANVTPKVTITGVMAGRPFAPAGIDVPLMATFTDPGALDTHVGAVTWGDGSATNLGAVQRSGLSATHAFASPGNYQVEAAVTDKDNGAGTATTSVTVLSPAAAGDAITGLLKGLLGRGDAQTDALLRTAIDQLGSRNSGVATNGAAALLRGGDRVAALEKLGKAETALRAVTRLDVAAVRLLIAQTAQSVAQTAAGNARAAAGCTVLTATSCTATEQKAITAIDQLITSGKTALGSSAYATAIAAFKDATQRAVTLGG